MTLAKSTARALLLSGLISTSFNVLAAPLPALLPLPPLVAPLPPSPAVTDYKSYGSGVPLAEFLKKQLRGVLNRPYILSPAAASESSLISVDLSGVKQADVLTLVREVLSGMGYELRDVRGVFYVDKKQTSDKKQEEVSKDLFVYAPRYRDVSSLSSYFPMFPGLGFASAAGMSVKSLQATTAGTSAGGGQSGGTMGSDFSTGATTFSQKEGDPSLLVVRGSTKDLAQFKDFLAVIDIAVPEVLVRAYILEVRTKGMKDSGVSFALSLLNDKLKLSLGAASTGGDSLRLALPSGSLSAAVSALAGNSRVRLVSAPVLRAADGSSASSSIGTDTPTLGAVTTQNGSATQSISYQQAGVLLTIAPRVFKESIRLKISQEVSSFVQTDTGLSATPTKLRRSFVSDVVAKSGEVILLGGLSDSSTSESSSKSFSFFGSDHNEKSNSEIVVLLSIESI